jgi:hypothetical protein
MPIAQGIAASGGTLPQWKSGNVTVTRIDSDEKNIGYQVNIPSFYGNIVIVAYRFWNWNTSATLQDSFSGTYNAGTDDPAINFMCDITVANANGNAATKTIGIFKSNVPYANPTVWNGSW